jgi:hypothetical protein
MHDSMHAFIDFMLLTLVFRSVSIFTLEEHKYERLHAPLAKCERFRAPLAFSLFPLITRSFSLSNGR